jgi:hypothetical protein
VALLAKDFFGRRIEWLGVQFSDSVKTRRKEGHGWKRINGYDFIFCRVTPAENHLPESSAICGSALDGFGVD